MLGVPFTIDNASSPGDGWLHNITYSQKLERLHVSIAEHIISRNVQMQHNGGPQNERNAPNPCYNVDDDEIKKIDDELKKAANLLPPSWWLVHSPTNTINNQLEKTGKLLLQLHQKYLIVLNHQPYLLVQAQDPETGKATKHIYSKLTAASASRELLSLYIVIRQAHQSPSYRAMDEKMYTSAVALLFAHLDGHRYGSANVLDHQRLHDIGLLGESISLMEKISTINNDLNSSLLIRIMRRLMIIENDTAEGSSYYACNDGNVEASDQNSEIITDDSLSLSIPYFGRISISRQRPQFSLEAFGDSDSIGSEILGASHDLHRTERTPQGTFTRDQEINEKDAWFDTWIDIGGGVN